MLNSTCAKEIESPNSSLSKKSRLILIVSGILWLFIVCIGLWVLWSYENTPGVSGTPPANWPAESQIKREAGRATLVLVAHPHCPCTRASIGELAAIMTACEGRLTAYVLLLKPTGFADGWEKTDLWESAAKIPGVQVLHDDEGAEARRFHAATSGQTMLYDAEGRLLFSGGITASRGHSGDNAGRSAIVSLVNAGTADRDETFVFGCELFDKNSICWKSIDDTNKH